MHSSSDWLVLSTKSRCSITGGHSRESAQVVSFKASIQTRYSNGNCTLPNLDRGPWNNKISVHVPRSMGDVIRALPVRNSSNSDPNHALQGYLSDSKCALEPDSITASTQHRSDQHYQQLVKVVQRCLNHP